MKNILYKTNIIFFGLFITASITYGFDVPMIEIEYTSIFDMQCSGKSKFKISQEEMGKAYNINPMLQSLEGSITCHQGGSNVLSS